MDLAHLPDDWQELTIPAIRLFTCRRVEQPILTIHELWKRGWIAVHGAERIAVLVFDRCMEDVDRETDSIQPGLPRCENMLKEDARAVIETERWLSTRHVRGEGGKEKLLRYSGLKSCAESNRAGERTSALDMDSASKNTARARMIPQHRTIS